MVGRRNHDDDEDEKEGREPRLGDALKKVLAAGVSAAFMTEESLRSYLGEAKLPKDILNLLLQSATKTKDEIATRVTNEMVNIIHKIDFVREASRFAEEHKFKISAEVEIVRKDKPAKQQK